MRVDSVVCGWVWDRGSITGEVLHIGNGSKKRMMYMRIGRGDIAFIYVYFSEE